MKLSEKNKDFFHNVFDVVRLIPEGRVTSYGAIAKYLGAPRSSRMVGWAMNASHKEEGIPAHRVVNRNGLLSGRAHFNPPEAMEKRLKSEGMIVKEDQIQNFKSVYWDPSEELKL
jgi:methylated-DNA-protein-cysteine methyltransferase-like protein